jgi:nitrite reductase/ring-hydroxylating ferredoxin subunit/uncharacterized membrane protein
MKPEFIEDQVARQGWVNAAEKALDAMSDATVKKSGSALRNFLHGTWLGHPLHPATVEVPIGAFTTATLLDVMDAARGTRRYAAGADAAVGIGLVTASLAAASGLADWSKSDQPGRRVGVLHAVLNGSATLCYLVSWILRKRGERAAAMNTGIAGWFFLMVGSFLGGRLVYNHKLGVDHAEREGPEGFTAVMPISELPENVPHRVEANGVGVLLVHQNGRVLAIGEKCAHLGGPLEEGQLDGNTITCPWHGSKFNIETGRVMEGPSAYSQPCFETRVVKGQIEVRINKRM